MLKQATFRFYEELNDFLPSDKKKVEFVHPFSGNPSIKDSIEAIGVPHVEVDLILVNGISVDFKYILQDKDMVSVYPVFETLRIDNVTHLRPKPLRNPTFILDVHLGKLAKYLRMLGFDTLYRNDNDDPEIIRISLDEHRIILTRDIGLLKVKTVNHAYFVRDQHPKGQLSEVLSHFDLYHDISPFNRCIKCNGQLEPVDKEKIIHQLEPLTIKYFNEFYRCKNCLSIFWEGSHFEHMEAFIQTIQEQGNLTNK
ncbi:MAG: Mut7-C RNAse domain-containing protein [Paludibacter sp.]|nr:Mut7-C RNAse domain-containing protein [Paludibacter sp.]